MFFEACHYPRHSLVKPDYLGDQFADVTIEAFLADETLRRAFVRSLEIIGEATNEVPEEFQAAHPEVEWRAMAGMRDREIVKCCGSAA